MPYMHISSDMFLLVVKQTVAVLTYWIGVYLQCHGNDGIATVFLRSRNNRATSSLCKQWTAQSVEQCITGHVKAECTVVPVLVSVLL